jgi:chromosome segregation ATPase
VIRRRDRLRQPDPHPDPVIERELERIRQLQRRCHTKEDQIHDYRVEIDNLHGALRRYERKLVGNPVSPKSVRDAIEAADKRVLSLQAEIRQIEAEIDKVHDEVGARQDRLSPSDLSYL